MNKSHLKLFCRLSKPVKILHLSVFVFSKKNCISERIAGLCAQSWPQEMENITKVRCLLYPYNSSETVYPWSLEHQSLRPHGETASNSNKLLPGN